MEPRLTSNIWVSALLRRCERSGAAAFVVQRGDSTSGVVLVKVNRLDGTCSVFSPARTGEGKRLWIRATGPEWVAESDADSYIARERNFDPDLWVIEVEDREGRHFLEEPVDEGKKE